MTPSRKKENAVFIRQEESVESPIPVKHVKKTWLSSLKPGDPVERRFSADGPGIALVVTQIIQTRIICGTYVFDVAITGAEINEELGWGVGNTYSYIRPPRS